MNILPEIYSAVLDNGMKIYVVERPDQPAVELECHVRTGSIHEEADLGRGLSHFLEHMMFQGCRDYPGTAAADKLSSLGGDANAYTGFDRTVYHCELPCAHWGSGLDVLSKMVLYPDFPEERFVSERDVILRECELGRDNPDRMLTERLLNQTFRVHPMRYPIIGYPSKIAEVSRDIMTAYYRRRYTPGRTFWLIAGNVCAEEVFEELHKLCGEWQTGFLQEPVLNSEPLSFCAGESNFTFEDPMSRLALGIRLPAAGAPEIPALDIMCGLLGMSDASRLVRKLRQETQLAVQTESFCYVQPFGGLLGIFAGTSPDRFAAMEQALRQELENVRMKGFSAAEVAREKNQQYAEQLRQLRTNSGITGVISSGIYAADSPRMAEDYMARLANITADEVNAAASAYLAPERMTTVRQTPAGHTAAALKTPETASGRKLSCCRMDCGAMLTVLEDHSLPLADAVMVLPGGTIFEKPGQGGLSALTSELILSGSAGLTEADIAEKLESLGATFSASSGLNSMILRVNAPESNFRELIILLNCILKAPLFGSREFEREKSNMLENLDSRMQQPRFAANQRAMSLMFGSHPYSHNTCGTAESVSALTRQDAQEFFRRMFVPDRTVIGIGGAVTRQEAEELAGLLAGGLAWVSGGTDLPPDVRYPEAPCQEIIAMNKEQTVVEYCLPSCSCLAPESPVLNLLSDAMNGLSSPLFKKIREDNAMAYSTGMRQFSGWHGGMLTFFAVTAAEKSIEALELLKAETVRLASEGLTETEFAEARDGAVFTLERLDAEPGSALYSAALSVYYGQSPEHNRQCIDILRRMTREYAGKVLHDLLSGVPGVSVIAGRIK